MIQKKVCLFGASGVGKTSLVRQFVDGIFSDKYLTTIGVKVDKKRIECEQQDVQLMLWDIEGTDRYSVFQERYLRGASAYIVVVDQTRTSSLIEGMDIHTLAKQVNPCLTVLAVNKSDLEQHWHWNERQLDDYRALFNLSFTTSAKTGDNVERMFQQLAELLVAEHK
ncbi:Rab family GTPase [Neptunicella sp. SCSIO 80796]|uniref:Rab family GTPase n=1 Tax=Neptunicella plasticusilytica TaxID=3117012 RepID=UPI003A4E07E9